LVLASILLKEDERGTPFTELVRSVKTLAPEQRRRIASSQFAGKKSFEINPKTTEVGSLTFERTETKMFFKCVWEKATAILFIKGRLKFYHVTGKQGDSAGAPSVLIAYGEENAEILKNCSIKGRYVRLS
jgi:hypothetical protein